MKVKDFNTYSYYGSTHTEATVVFDRKDDIPKEVEGILKPYYKQYGLNLEVKEVICRVDFEGGEMKYKCVANTNYGFAIPLEEFKLCGMKVYSVDRDDCIPLEDVDDIKDKIERGLMAHVLEKE